ncbi:MFS transporter [Xylanimonas ulmi]|uniref:Putative MFS family arabinose efflux permease n=1 Tax=Xylanimonas ulmi TaxID=228973 RepID=A0A4V2EXS6_9MICO|nr:MFS transporter [Xylanibacterium ulmi]RZS60520.1 putative MFS family arabinose efflux permease [Xylanibacterium ulmi]
MDDEQTHTQAARVTRAAWAVFAAYAAAGFAIGTVASRLPTVRAGLGLDSAQMGLVLLMWALGSVLSLPASGIVITRLGPARTAAGSGVVAGIGHVCLAVGVSVGSVPLAVAGLFTAGIGEGAWAAATTFQGALVERRLGYAAMPRFQAGESLGTVAGSGLGALLAATGLPLLGHMGLAATLAVVTALVSARSFLTASAAGQGVPADGDAAAARRGTALRATLAAWREPRTLLLGLVILGAALAEGAASDWTSLGLVSGFGASESTGAAGVAVFFSAMLTMRLFGSHLIGRLGRVASLRLCAGAVLVGIALFALSPWLPLALAGSFVWGLGAALGFPLGVSAASDDPLKAAMRVSVVTTIGYLAYLVGPVVIGLVAQSLGYRGALVVAAVPVLLGVLAAGAARPLDERGARARGGPTAGPTAGPVRAGRGAAAMPQPVVRPARTTPRARAGVTALSRVTLRRTRASGSPPRPERRPDSVARQ